MNASTAHDLGFITHLVDVAGVETCIQELAHQGKPANKYPGHPANSESSVAKFATSFFSDANMVSLMQGNCPEGFDVEEKMVARQIKSLSFTAPIGLKMASDLIDATASTSLSDGLQLELDGLNAIFSTKDALEGLSALIENRRPTYTNE